MSSNNPTAALLEAINELNKVIESLNKQLQQKEEEAARIQKERDLEIKLLREQIEYFKKQKFGPKSEKTSVITGQLVMPEVLERGQFDEAEESAEEDVLPEITTKKKTRKGYSREKVLVSLPTEEFMDFQKKIKFAPLMEVSFLMLGKNIFVLKLSIFLQQSK